MRRNLLKTLHHMTLESPIFESAIRVEEEVNDKPRTVSDYQFCRSTPKRRENPHVAGLSKPALELLDLDSNGLLEDPLATAEYLSGSKLLPGSRPICNNYCGYQFGNWAGQLGDGRAHLIGCYRNQHNQLFELQLKGSGVSPFSRFADGNSVVSSALREFLVSEAMHSLGVPTTRAGSLVICEQLVKRDPYYNGNIRMEHAAVVLRISPSFLRFGSFEICNDSAQCHKADPRQNRKLLQALSDYLIKQCYPGLQGEDMDPYEGLFLELVERSARLVAKWQSIGFVHGVLNTDNMSMLGLTIDYGPFSFIDYFSKDFVSNLTDDRQRYSYRQQPTSIKWNLNMLAEAFDPLVPTNILKKHVVQEFDKVYFKQYYRLMREKLGLLPEHSCEELIDELFDIMHQFASNFTNVFTILSSQLGKDDMLEQLVSQSCPTDVHLSSLRAFPQLAHTPPELIHKLLRQDEGFNKYLITEQPLRLARKHHLENTDPKDYLKQQKQVWSTWLSKYGQFPKDRTKQLAVNPKYTLRNDVANRILKDLTDATPSSRPELLARVLGVLQNPYQSDAWFEKRYWLPKCDPIKLTCSS